MSNHSPKKSLGQNFLTSVPARIAIVSAGNLTINDTVLEIGPGKGFLTKGLLESGATVVVLEKDRELLPILEETFSQEIRNKKLTIIEGDALLFDTSVYFKSQFSDSESKPTTYHLSPSSADSGHLRSQASRPTTYKLIANIPYYITGAILSKYLSSPHQPTQMVVLVQKEVAERIVARDKKESILSLAVKVYGDPKLVYRVKRGSFNPIPNVDSAVLSIENISRKNFKNKKHEENFFLIVKSGFAHKRKFLISNLKEKIPITNWQELFIKNNLNEKVRAEDVPLSIWLQLSLEII